MRVISFQDIVELNISPTTCYKWAEKMILHKSDVVLPAKIHMDMSGNRFCNIMPSIVNNVNGRNVGGVKMVTRYPDRAPSFDSVILLFDAETGENLALLDGNWITAMRTGAVASHSIIHFAKEAYCSIGMIGLGNTARATLLVLAEKVKDKELTIKLLKYKDQAELFIDRFKQYENLHFEVIDDVKDVICNSDVILSCATYFGDDIGENEWFDEGVLVIPVHTRGFTNCDLFFDKVFADDTSHVSHFTNFAKFKRFAEVSAVMNGSAVGRENNQERIIIYNIGVSSHDVFAAAKIFHIFENNDEAFEKLQNVDMESPTEKFWL